MVRDPLDDTQTFAIGKILTRMRITTTEQVEESLEMQRTTKGPVKIGDILMSMGLVTQGQLNIALEAQDELRSPKKHVRALAAAKIAQVSSRSVQKLAKQVRDTSDKIRRETTGDGWPAVTDEILKNGAS